MKGRAACPQAAPGAVGTPGPTDGLGDQSRTGRRGGVLLPARALRVQRAALALVAGGLIWWAIPDSLGGSLVVQVRAAFGRDALAFDVPVHQTAAGQRVSVTRLDLLLSGLSLRRVDGAWVELADWQGFFGLRAGAAVSPPVAAPASAYDRIRFHVGVAPPLNHADPVQWPADHPLNPAVNGLHWSWQGGYVFLALEGNWQSSADLGRGYSWHLATDRQLAPVELPVSLDLASPRTLALTLDLARLFAGPPVVTLDEETASTHSREGDRLADQIREALATAFSAEALDPSPAAGPERPPGPRLEAAPGATPYLLKTPKYFPLPALPADNPLTEEGVLLGSLLFFDPRLSVNSSQACASCHQPEAAFADRGRAVSVGAEGQHGERNAMPLFNLAWKSAFFWDGRTASLREQVLQPIENPVEMHARLPEVVVKLRRARVNPHHAARALRAGALEANARAGHDLSVLAGERAADYAGLFWRTFGTPDVTADRVARALEQFLLTRISQDSKFDRALRGEAELSIEEKRGAELFHTEYDPRRRQFGADCFHCHGGPLFRNQAFANNGLEAEPADLGRFRVTGREGDRGKFAVPSLRNVALTAPYMHDGRLATLDEVVRHYTSGVQRSRTLDPNLAKHPQGGVPLSAADQAALVAFLKCLTDVQTWNPSGAW